MDWKYYQQFGKFGINIENWLAGLVIEFQGILLVCIISMLANYSILYVSHVLKSVSDLSPYVCLTFRKGLGVVGYVKL